MHKSFRLSAISIITIGLLGISTASFADPNLSTAHRHYNYGYDDGYEDGYDDAMEDCPCPDKLFRLGGWYAGAGVGYDSYNGNRQIDFGEDLFGRFRMNATGWNGSIYGGYDHYFQPNKYGSFYLGGEVFIGSSSASGNDHVTAYGNTYSGSLSARTSYGLDIRPGFKFEKLPLLYLNLGKVNTNFQNSETVNGWQRGNSTWETGCQYGIGLEAPITNKVGLRLDYNHINYDSFNGSNPNTKIEPSDNQFRISANFHF